MTVFYLYRATTVTALSIVAIACSSDPASPGGSSPNPAASDSGGTTPVANDAGRVAAGLSCASYGFCNSYSVRDYDVAQVPTPVGGQIMDGLYRIGYTFRVNGMPGTSSRGGYAEDAFLISGSEYLSLGGGSGNVGALSTSGTELTMTPRSSCASWTATPSSGSPRAPYTKPYSVDSEGNLLMFGSSTSGGIKKTTVDVYVRVTSLCKEPASISQTNPGDSFFSNAANKGCTEASGPPSQSTCKYVHGG